MGCAAIQTDKWLQVCHLVHGKKNSYILLFKVVRFFCLKLKISITTETIGFSVLGKHHTGPVMVLGYFVFRFQTLDGFQLFL